MQVRKLPIETFWKRTLRMLNALSFTLKVGQYKNMNKNNVIVILGSGRSGTSWLHDVLTSHFNYRRIFEPLHPTQVKSISRFAGLYLSSKDEEETLYKYIHNVYHYRTDDAWLRWSHLGITKDTKITRKILQFGYNLPKFKFWAKNRVVKFIQANLMISWLSAKFPYKTVFIIREPFSVIKSQLNMGWSHDLKLYIQQPKIRQAIPHLDLEHLERSFTTIEERLTARWCIENYIAVNEVRRFNDTSKIIPLTYEKVKQGNNISVLLEKLNYSSGEIKAVLRNSMLRDKFRSSKRKSTAFRSLDERQLKLIRGVLEIFKMENYEDFTRDFDEIFK